MYFMSICPPAHHILLYPKEKPPSASYPNKPLGGAYSIHNRCINKLLPLEDVIVKMESIPFPLPVPGCSCTMMIFDRHTT